MNRLAKRGKKRGKRFTPTCTWTWKERESWIFLVSSVGRGVAPPNKERERLGRWENDKVGKGKKSRPTAIGTGVAGGKAMVRLLNKDCRRRRKGSSSSCGIGREEKRRRWRL